MGGTHTLGVCFVVTNIADLLSPRLPTGRAADDGGYRSFGVRRAIAAIWFAQAMTGYADDDGQVS